MHREYRANRAKEALYCHSTIFEVKGYVSGETNSADYIKYLLTDIMFLCCQEGSSFEEILESSKHDFKELNFKI